MKKVIFLICMLLSSLASAQDISRDEMISYMKKIVRNKDFVEKTLASYKVEGYVDEMINSRMLSEENLNSIGNNIDARKFGAELSLNLMLKGMARLDVKDMRSFIKYVEVLLNSMNYKQCKKYLVDGSSMTATENVDIEVKAYKYFTKQELENYFSVSRKALFAELRSFPLVKTINADEKKMADKAFENELVELAKQNKVPIELFDAMIDMENATDKNACEAGRIILNTIVNLKGFTGDLMIKSYIISIQE